MANGMRKTVLTTGEVARICNVAPRTVSKWFDSGRLRGYRIPGSRDRRIPVDQLIRFMKAHDIPTANLPLKTPNVLLVATDTQWLDSIRNGLAADDAFEVTTADSLLEAGYLMAECQPQALLIDVDVLNGEPVQVCRTCRSHEQLSGVKLIAVGSQLTEGSGQSLLQIGFDAYLRKPFNITELRDVLNRILTVTE